MLNYSFWKPYVSPRFLADKLRERGLLWCLRTGAGHYSRLIFIILPLELFKLIVILLFRYPLYYKGVRFINITFWGIGHLGADSDCFIKEGILGMRPNFFEIWLVYPKTRVANQCLLNYWRKHIRIISSPFLCRILNPLSRDEKLEYKDACKYHSDPSTAARMPVIQRAWGDRPPLLSLSESDRERGWGNLRQLGMPTDAWFVTIHCRESGFFKMWYGFDEQSGAFRNVDIDTYIPAMKAVVERGGYCIRMGDPTMKPLPEMDNVIDYVYLDIKSDWMDVFLLASCKFLLGSASGLFGVCGAFGVPVATANIAPMGQALFPCGPRDIGIPKLIWSSVEGRLLTFKEVLDSPTGNFNWTHWYIEAGVSVVDNSPEDIRDLALEMLGRIEGKAIYTAEDERLQERFKSLLTPGHHSYGGSSRVGRDFLRRHAMLLPNEEFTVQDRR